MDWGASYVGQYRLACAMAILAHADCIAPCQVHNGLNQSMYHADLWLAKAYAAALKYFLRTNYVYKDYNLVEQFITKHQVRKAYNSINISFFCA